MMELLLWRRRCEMIRWSYALVDAELQAPVLDHVNAVVRVAGAEEALPLLQLHEHHVTAQFQEQWLLKVTQHPGSHGKHKPTNHTHAEEHRRGNTKKFSTSSHPHL